MRVLQALVSASIAGAALAASLEASVYMFGGPPSSVQGKDASTISPSTARLLLARRLGLSHYHSLKSINEEEIAQINDLSGHQKPLFAVPDDDQVRRKVMVVVEGIHNPEKLMDGLKPTFKISEPPAPANNIELIADLLTQAAHKYGSDATCDAKKSVDFESNSISGGVVSKSKAQCMIKKPTNVAYNRDLAVKELDLLEDLGNAAFKLAYGHESDDSSFQDSTMIFQVQSLEAMARRDGPASSGYTKAAAKLKNIIKKFSEHADTIDTTVIIMPMIHKHAIKQSKPYGSYEIPGNRLQARQAQEAPLTLSNTVNVNAETSSTLTSATTTATIKTTMPLCYTEEKICIAATNNCSFHGACFRKYKEGGKVDQTGKECWTCGCKPTVRTDSKNRTSTTYWGGPACQKEDISAPFLLLAGFTVAIVAAVTWGIGMLYSIGQEPLPSVIGAGVAGPRAQK